MGGSPEEAVEDSKHYYLTPRKFSQKSYNNIDIYIFL